MIRLRQQGIWFLPLSRFPLRGQAGGTTASAALRLGQGTGPKQNASRVLGRQGRRLDGRGSAPDPGGKNFMMQTGQFTC